MATKTWLGIGGVVLFALAFPGCVTAGITSTYLPAPIMLIAVLQSVLNLFAAWRL